jgi:hypothetical protein
MSKTYKDKSDIVKWKSKSKISFKMKREAKEKRKKLKYETNPRVLKLASCDSWNYN